MKKFLYSMVGSLVVGNGGADYAEPRIFLHFDGGYNHVTAWGNRKEVAENQAPRESVGGLLLQSNAGKKKETPEA